MVALLVALAGGLASCSASGTQGCSVSQADCNGDPADGCETNLMVDPKHCGSCAKVCPGISTQTALCHYGVCTTCPGARLDCNALGADGCEVKVNNDPQNCSRCGNVCPAIANGSAGCLNGVCNIERCNLGFSDCNGDPSDGCETNTLTDAKNCGNCNSPCPNLAGGPVTCQKGSCVIGMCKPGFDSCSPDSPLQSCETNLSSDVYNCGACGLLCPATPANTSRSCTMMTCSAVPCATPWMDCNKVAGDGCETDTSRDPSNCGACGNKCGMLPNASSLCLSSQCLLTSCNANFGDCNGKIADGCEAKLLTDVSHCGACAIACLRTSNSSAVSCQAGQCNVDTCNSGYEDCDGLYNNGCEANLATDPFNCRVCGNTCVPKPHVQPLCKNSTCMASALCDAGYLDCDGNVNNGCEVDMTNDPLNCGGCKMPCAAGQSCMAGKCM